VKTHLPFIIFLNLVSFINSVAEQYFLSQVCPWL